MPAAAASPSSDTRVAPGRPLAVVDGAQRANGTVGVAVAVGPSLVRGGIRALLERASGIAVVDEAATGDDLVALARRTRPHVLVMDVELPALEHVRATRDVLAEGVAVMLLAPGAADPRVLPALRAGATGLLAQDADPAGLVAAVRALGQGASFLSSDLARQLAHEAHHHPRENRMLTPTVVELRRGCARGRLLRPLKLLAPTPAPARG